MCEEGNRFPFSSILKQISTPFTMYAHSSAAFTQDLYIEKLIEFSFNHSSIGVVGLSERGADGGWDYKCQQLAIENGHLTIVDGYYHSTGLCMFCDATSSSFLVATDVLRITFPDGNLPFETRFIDWGIRLKKTGVVVANCPQSMHLTTRDIMYEIKQEPLYLEDKQEYISMKKTYKELAVKWKFSIIRTVEDILLKYTCSEISFECSPRSRVKHYMLPQCCLDISSEMLKDFSSIAKRNLFPYKINSGTLLGAVKFKGSIPWDFDHDWNFPIHMADYIESKRNDFLSLGFFNFFRDKPFTIKKGNYFTAYYKQGFSLDLYGNKNIVPVTNKTDLPRNVPCLLNGFHAISIDSYLKGNYSKDKKDVNGQINCYLNTYLKFGSYWIQALWNPVGAIANMYPGNTFKHRLHWRFEKDIYSWPPCPQKEDSLCLDVHPMDGNIPFL